ncbi:hypothetical protein [Leptolyngbya sp. FACHB-17]|uniref:hypothetical protein n=1 Tax=unclassified Leptolyngbya TaxID=2650499 RepID=UPI0016806BAE|nr:hypothetical protein [Leptolyngbya sp. FACHB-17]MBD2078662.1 hypothetical protein [Leptolyngbya sp. FACHB-17]
MLTSLKQLLARIVDYAGIFPPAQLSLSEAINIYDRAHSSPHCSMLDRFVLPATRLSEFIKLLPSEDASSSQPWSLSVIVSKNWRSELEQIYQATKRDYKPSIQISALEVAPLPPVEIESIRLEIPAEVDTFFEIPFNVDLEPYLDILHQIRAGAKLRTGGIISDAFPDSTQLGQRILSLANARIPFKATAGLHHALRGHCFTHAPNKTSTTMHGFLNVAIASAFAYQQAIPLNEVVAILEESSIDSFQLSDIEIGWHEFSLPILVIEHSRQQFFRSFGSCSFEEPIHELYDLKLL